MTQIYNTTFSPALPPAIALKTKNSVEAEFFVIMSVSVGVSNLPARIAKTT